MVDPTDITPQVITLEDSVPLTPNPDHVGLNAVMHAVVAGDVSNGIMFANGDKEQVALIVRKISSGESIITVDCPNACSQGYTTEHDLIAHMQAGDSTPTYKVLGPWPKSRWATTITSPYRVRVNFSGVTTGLELMVLRMPIVAD